jgi:hypothetical protein
MADSAQKKNKGGRPPRSPGEKLDQFSIRLTPKLKFGLELLARAQNRSLSQAVEWALQVGLNSFRVNNEWEKVSDLLDRVWEEKTDFDRLYAIYLGAPNLLSFEDRVACEVIERSREFEDAHESVGIVLGEHGRKSVEDLDKLQAWQRERIDIFFDFVRRHWKQLSAAAVAHVAGGRQIERVKLLDLLGYGKLAPLDQFAVMKASAENKEVGVNLDVGHRAAEIDNSTPWSKNFRRWTGKEILQFVGSVLEKVV